jgi:putative endonuclease
MGIYPGDYCPLFRESDMIPGIVLSWLSMIWSVYIIEVNDNSYYTGIATDVARRFAEHGGTVRGAKYFNGRKPVKVAYREDGHTRSSASKREAEIKKLSRAQKSMLINGVTQ